LLLCDHIESGGTLKDARSRKVMLLGTPAEPVDSFTADMDSILQVPGQAAAANAGGMPEDTQLEYEHRMAWVRQASDGAAGGNENSKLLVENVRKWADLQNQLVTVDLAHRWRIDAVTHRYQQHMEKVRLLSRAILPQIARGCRQKWPLIQA
jgi:hypothetical protein